MKNIKVHVISSWKSLKSGHRIKSRSHQIKSRKQILVMRRAKVSLSMSNLGAELCNKTIKPKTSLARTLILSQARMDKALAPLEDFLTQARESPLFLKNPTLLRGRWYQLKVWPLPLVRTTSKKTSYCKLWMTTIVPCRRAQCPRRRLTLQAHPIPSRAMRQSRKTARTATITTRPRMISTWTSKSPATSRSPGPRMLKDSPIINNNKID